MDNNNGRGFWVYFFSELGFKNGSDFFNAVFGVKSMYVSFQLIGALAAAILSFSSDWIWRPPQALFLVIVMTLVNARYGYLVAKHIKLERFSWKKFKRTFSIVVSDVVIMALIHNAVLLYPYYDFLPDILFGWFLMHKVAAIWEHMTALKLQKGGFAEVLKKHILESKIGSAIVDSVQRDKPEIKKEENE